MWNKKKRPKTECEHTEGASGRHSTFRDIGLERDWRKWLNNIRENCEDLNVPKRTTLQTTQSEVEKHCSQQRLPE